MTLKDIRNQLEQSLGLQNGDLDQVKNQVKEMIIEILTNRNNLSSSNDEKSDQSDVSKENNHNGEEEEEKEPKLKKKKITTPKSTPKSQTTSSTAKRKRETLPKKETSKKAKTSTKKLSSHELDSPDDDALRQFKSYILAASIGPNVYRGVKDLPKKEQIDLLYQRLADLGHKLDCPPTKAQIAAAKRDTMKKQALDGIDTSLIIDTPRRARRTTNVVSYAEKKGSEDESQNGSNHDDDDDDDEVEFDDDN